MLFIRRHLRSWATRVLALWLFGIGAGLANTCLAASLLDAGVRGHANASSAAAKAEPPSAIRPSAHSHEHESGPGGHGGAHDKANCQDFCDKVTLSLPINKSAVDDIDHAVAPPPATVFFADLVVARVPSWAPRPLGSLDPPIRIAFARLAL